MLHFNSLHTSIHKTEKEFHEVLICATYEFPWALAQALVGQLRSYKLQEQPKINI